MPVWQILLQEIVAMIWYDYAGLILDLAKMRDYAIFFFIQISVKKSCDSKEFEGNYFA